MKNLGNIVGLLLSSTAPQKKYVIWAEPVNSTTPEIVNLKYYDHVTQSWEPLRQPAYWLDPVQAVVDQPPGTASNGDRYLMSREPSVGFEAYANMVAQFEQGSWIYLPTRAGASVQVIAANNTYTHQAGVGFVANAGADAGTGSMFFADIQGDPNNNMAMVTALEQYRDAAISALRDGVGSQHDTLNKISQELSQLSGVNLKLPLPFDAATETTFPTGSTEAGDTYYVTVAGTVDGVALGVGDFMWTSLDNATAVADDWNVLPRSTDNATTENVGLVELATQAEALDGTSSHVITAALLKYWRDERIGQTSDFNAYLNGDPGARNNLMKAIGGAVADYLQGTTQAASIFITNVQAVNAGAIVNLTTDPGAVGQQIVTALSTNDDEVDLTVRISGGAQWSPAYTVNGVTLSLTQIADTHEFIGTARVPLPDGTGALTITGNGGRSDIPVNFIADAPAIQSVSFGSYPAAQTELKTGDQITTTLELESTTDVTQIIVEDYGAFGAQNAAVTILNGTQVEVLLTVQHSHSDTVAGTAGLRARVRMANGSESNAYTSGNDLTINNYGGTLSVDSVTYPATQTALKDNEAATLNLTYADVDSVYIQSTELSVVDPSVLAASKTANLNATGQAQGYRNTGTNVAVNYTRDANGKTSTVNALVKIAHDDAALADNTLVVLRADGSITINLTQVPESVSFVTAPSGTFDALTQVDSDTWSLALLIGDGVTRSDTTHQAELSVTNQAGKVVSLLRQYKVRGFMPKQITFVYNSFSEPLPVNVTDPANLVVNGVIQSSPTFELNNMQQDAALDDATDFDLSGGNLLLSTELESFGYGAGVDTVITIEETV